MAKELVGYIVPLDLRRNEKVPIVVGNPLAAEYSIMPKKTAYFFKLIANGHSREKYENQAALLEKLRKNVMSFGDFAFEAGLNAFAQKNGLDVICMGVVGTGLGRKEVRENLDIQENVIPLSHRLYDKTIRLNSKDVTIA